MGQLISTIIIGVRDRRGNEIGNISTLHGLMGRNNPYLRAWGAL